MKLGIREYAFLAVLVAVPVSAWFFVFQPRNEDIGQARREITSMQSTLARLDTLTGEVGDVRERIDEAEMRLADFGRIIPNAEEVEDLLAEMHRIADRNRLSIESIRALKQQTVQGYLEIPHTVSIEGDFEGSVTGYWVRLDASGAGIVSYNRKEYTTKPIGFTSLPKGVEVELSHATGVYYSKF